MVVMVEKRFEGRDILSSSTNTTTTTEPPGFAATMSKLERLSPSRLHPRMKPWYLKRYRENPEGFEVTAEESLEGRNPLGLFHSKLSAGLHLGLVAWAPSPPTPKPKPDVRGQGVCFVCEQPFDDAYLIAGQWYCPSHESLAPA